MTVRGRRILVPRPAERSSALLELLTAAGAHPVAVPLIRTVPADPAVLSVAVQGDFDWMCLTSPAAVDAVAGLGWSGRVAVVGAATAAVAVAAGLSVDLVPDGPGSAAALGAAFPDGPGTVLLPLSALANDVLADALTAKGWTVTRVTAYRTEIVPPPADVAAELAAGGFDAVLVTSGSTVAALAGLPVAAAVVAIGRNTARAAADAGLPVTAVADHPDDASLVAALDSLFSVAPAGRSIP